MRIRGTAASALVSTLFTGAVTAVVCTGCSEPNTKVGSRSEPVSSRSAPNNPSLPAPITSGAVMPPGPAGDETVPVTPVIAATPEEVKAAWKEGVRLFDSKDYATAASSLQIAVTGRSNDPYAHYLLGLALWKSGQTALAEQSLEMSSGIGSGSLKTWTNLARVRLELQDGEGALEAAEKGVAIASTDGNALHQKGRALALLGRRDEAIDTLRLAHESDPDNGQIANTLGYWLVQYGRPGEAVPYLQIARDRLPSVAYVRNNLGVACERTGSRGEAVAEYRAAVDCGDSGGRAASSLARLGELSGEPLTKSDPQDEQVAKVDNDSDSE